MSTRHVLTVLFIAVVAIWCLVVFSNREQRVEKTVPPVAVSTDYHRSGSDRVVVADTFFFSVPTAFNQEKNWRQMCFNPRSLAMFFDRPGLQHETNLALTDSLVPGRYMGIVCQVVLPVSMHECMEFGQYFGYRTAGMRELSTICMVGGYSAVSNNHVITIDDSAKAFLLEGRRWKTFFDFERRSPFVWLGEILPTPLKESELFIAYKKM